MGLPDATELELISQLRGRLSDLLPTMREEQKTDLFLVRWIRARENNLDLAEQMLRDSMKWRAENDMDNILTWVPPEEVVQMCPVEFIGYDKYNSPVTYIPNGKWNFKKIFQLGYKDVFLKYMDQVFEQMLQRMEGKLTPNGEPVTQAFVIGDKEHLSIRTMASVGAVDMFLQMVKRFDLNQPEIVRKIVIMNAGSAFASLFSMVKPLMSERTGGKMFIFSAGNLEKCRELFREEIPLDVLPVKLGGTNTNFKDRPALHSYEPKGQEDDSGMLSVTVPTADKLIVLQTVNKPLSTITWAFKTDKYDIAFAVHSGDKIYVENSRVNSNEQTCEGTITCDTPGDYIFTFDNTYSRLRTKTLEYRIDVKTPEGQDQVMF